MASRLFPDSGSRYALRANGDQAGSGVIEYYRDAAGQNRAPVYADRGTDDPDPDDAFVNSTTHLDAYGGQVDFRGPGDDTDLLYARVDGGPIFRVPAAPEPRLRLLEAAVGSMVVNVKDAPYNAVGDGVADDTVAIAAAEAAVHAAGGGCVYFPAGTYLTTTQTLHANVLWRGASRAGSVVKLKNATNADLLVTEGFATYTNTTANGPSGFGLASITLDANRAGQTATSRCFKAYGYNYTVRDVWFLNGYGCGVYSEWGGNANPMESLWSDVKIWNYGGRRGCRGLDWNGPHDSKFNNLIVATLDSTIRPTDVTYGTTPINGSAVNFPGPGTPFTFVTTEAASTALFPESGGTFVVPVATSLNTWATVTYTSASTDGAVTTFTGCTSPVGSNRQAAPSSGIILPTYGVSTNMGSAGRGESGAVFTNLHAWGRNHVTVFGNSTIFCANSEAEGGFLASVVLTSGSVWVGGAVYGTAGQLGQENEVGIQLGWENGACGRSMVNTHVHNVGSAASTNGAGVFVSNSAGGNSIRIVGKSPNPARFASAFSQSLDVWDVICQDKTNLSFYANYTGVVPQFPAGIRPGGASTGGRIYTGSGAPNISTSQAGDFYFRTDTPTVVNQRLYTATAVNTWTGVL